MLLAILLVGVVIGCTVWAALTPQPPRAPYSERRR
jgi:hypothetical protein